MAVLLPIPAPGAYSYSVPDDLELAPGDIVQVPLGPRKVAAVVWDDSAGQDAVDPAKLRPVEQKFDCPPLTDDMRRFVDWVANYTLSPPGMVLKMVLRVPAALDPEAPLSGLVATDAPVERMTDARRRVLELARGEGDVDGRMAWTKSGLAHAAGVTPSVVDGLVKLGAFETVTIPPPPVVPAPDVTFADRDLEPDQTLAADALVRAVGNEGYSVHLLDGVTGSGKTEVYFAAIEAALAKGCQILIMLPEIALTADFLERFEQRFGAPPAPWHSGLAPKMREKVWRQVAEGRVRVVAGARSALFLPFENLGLIVVDEEHDSAYKQEDRVYYNARDMAVVRASLGGFTCVLASATPALESRVNAQSGRYDHLALKSRFAGAKLPDLHLIDMRKDPPKRGGFLSPVLLDAVGKALDKGEQSLLFLNRRGYAPLTLCRVCGFRFECDNCSAWLVEHRFRNQLQCHHCGDSRPIPEACPNCGALDHLVACGPGVERLAEEVDATFPEARIVVLSSDMMGGVSRLQIELDAIAQGQADIVIGTQVVAKGHNFPLLTCVGVVDADLGMANGDPRAAERTFQILSQVTGRAGRFAPEAAGYLQSYNPENPVLQAIVNGDREGFYERETAMRQATGLPPFSRLVSLIVSAEDRKQAHDHANALKQSALPDSQISLLGPAEAPIAMVRGRYRFRLLLRAPRSHDVQSYLRKWLAEAPKERGSVRLHIDVDPQSFL